MTEQQKRYAMALDPRRGQEPPLNRVLGQVGEYLYPQGWKGGILGMGNPSAGYNDYMAERLDPNSPHNLELRKRALNPTVTAAMDSMRVHGISNPGEFLGTGGLMGTTKMAGLVNNPSAIGEMLKSAGLKRSVDTLKSHVRDFAKNPESPKELATETRKALALRDKRVSAQAPDPLVRQAQMRPFKLERAREASKAVAPFVNAPLMQNFNKEFSERIMRAAKIDRGMAYREGAKATLEAITREAKKLGWKVDHTSSHNGRASSRYIEVPGAGKVRISDHEIPMTPQREFARATGRGPSWNGEIVIGPEWTSTTMTNYLRQVLLKAHGR